MAKQICRICDKYIEKGQVSVRAKAKMEIEDFIVVHKECLRNHLQTRTFNRAGGLKPTNEFSIEMLWPPHKTFQSYKDRVRKKRGLAHY